MLSLVCEIEGGIKIPCNKCDYKEYCYETDKMLNALQRHVRMQRGDGVNLRLRDFSFLNEIERREEEKER